VSAKAESSVVLLKKLRLLHKMHLENPHREYEAIITRVKNFGIYFEIIDLMVEGFLHISELGEDYFVYEEEKMRLRGTRRGGFYAPGDRLTVMLKDVDFVLQETKWYAVANEHAAMSAQKPKKPSRSGKRSASPPERRLPKKDQNKKNVVKKNITKRNSERKPVVLKTAHSQSKKKKK
jgi:ribonuclease R